VLRAHGRPARSFKTQAVQWKTPSQLWPTDQKRCLACTVSVNYDLSQRRISLALAQLPLGGRRSYVDSVDRVVAVRSMEEPLEVLHFMSDNSDSDTRTFEAALRRCGYLVSGSNYKQVVSDARFHAILSALATRLDDCDAHMLSMIADASARFRTSTQELSDLAQRLAEVIVRREDSFSPRNLATIALALSVRSVRDNSTVEFIRAEATKLIHDFEPAHCNMFLEALRRWGIFDRQLVDLLVERLSDEIDRFTSRDVVDCLGVVSRLGLARGFLLRRLCTLAFDNLEQFSSSELVRMAYALAKLRFLDHGSLDSIVDTLSLNLPRISVGQVSNLIFALAMTEAHHQADLVRDLVARFAADESPKTLTALADVAWALCALDMVRELEDDFKNILNQIFEMQPPQNRVPLMKMFDVICALELEYKDVSVSIPAIWKAASDDADRYEMDRLEPSRLHNEIVTRLDHLSGMANGVKWSLRMQRNHGCGPFRVDMMDEETKLVLDVEIISWPTSRKLKHRLAKGLGYKPLLLEYWEWRRARTEEDQAAFLEREIVRVLESES